MNRCKAFLTALNDRGCGAALIHRPENIRWLTGYTGEGCVFVSENAQVVVTDFRYVEQAGRQAPECDCRRTGNGVSESAVVRELCQAQGVKRLCVETDYLTHDEYLALEKALEGVELIPLSELPQELRLIKDAGEIESIQKAAAISCRAFDNLLGKIHPGMTEKQVQIMLD